METTEGRIIRRDLLVALGGAFVYRLLFAVSMGRVIAADSIHYVSMGRQFLSGDFFNFDDLLPILYPALGAVVGLVVPDIELAFRIVSFIFSTLLVVPLYLLARMAFGVTAARIAALTVAIWPWYADYGLRVAPEALATFLLVMSVWLLVKGIREGGICLYLAPFFFFALHLARPEGTFLLLGAPVAALILFVGREGSEVPEPLRRWLIFTALVVLLVVSYAFAMGAIVGTPTVSYRAPMAGDLISYFRHGGIRLVKTLVELNSHVIPVMLGPLLLIFAGVGLFQSSGKARDFRLELVILFFCAIQYALIVVNFSPAPRYVMPIVALLSMWSAQGMVIVSQTAGAFAGRTHRRPAQRLATFAQYLPVTVLVLFMAFGGAVTVAGEHVGEFPREPREYKIVGKWMRENLEPGIVITRKPQIGFYAEMPTTGPARDDTPEDVLRRALHIRARYFVLDERYTAKLAPSLEPLLDPANALPQFRLVRDDLSPYPSARVVIYEIVDPELRYRTPETFRPPETILGPYKKRRTIRHPTDTP